MSKNFFLLLLKAVAKPKTPGCFSKICSRKKTKSIINNDLTIPNEVDEFLNEDATEYQEFQNNTIKILSKEAENESESNEETPANHNRESDITKIYFTYDYKNGTGELYMRVGTAIFSVCALISSSLKLVQMADIYLNNYEVMIECKYTFMVTLVSKILSILFIFIQSFFIFKYANIVIHYGKNTAIIGLMHIICTNFVVFTKTVVAETVSEIRDLQHMQHLQIPDKRMEMLDKNDYFNKTIQHHKRSVLRNSLSTPKYLGCIDVNSLDVNVSLSIQETQDKISIYLYPCVIEYSLMAMTIFYILWASIKSRYDSNNKYGSYDVKPSISRRKSRGFNSSFVRASIDMTHEKALERMNHLIDENQQSFNKFTIDCGKSTTGLFFGIFVLLVTVRKIKTIRI